MPNPPRNTKPSIIDFPTSIRLPADLKKDIKEEAIARQWPMTYVIIDILRSWQNYRALEKKHKRTPKI